MHSVIIIILFLFSFLLKLNNFNLKSSNYTIHTIQHTQNKFINESSYSFFFQLFELSRINNSSICVEFRKNILRFFC
jgi:hypothetical protein